MVLTMFQVRIRINNEKCEGGLDPSWLPFDSQPPVVSASHVVWFNFSYWRYLVRCCDVCFVRESFGTHRNMSKIENKTVTLIHTVV